MSLDLSDWFRLNLCDTFCSLCLYHSVAGSVIISKYGAEALVEIQPKVLSLKQCGKIILSVSPLKSEALQQRNVRRSYIMDTICAASLIIALLSPLKG